MDENENVETQFRFVLYAQVKKVSHTQHHSTFVSKDIRETHAHVKPLQVKSTQSMQRMVHVRFDGEKKLAVKKSACFSLSCVHVYDKVNLNANHAVSSSHRGALSRMLVVLLFNIIDDDDDDSDDYIK